MRVLHVIPTLEKGGAERLVLDLARSHKGDFGAMVKVVVLNTQNAYTDLSMGLDIEYIRSDVEFSPRGKDKVNLSEYEKVVDTFKPDIIHSHLVKAELVSKYNLRPGIKYITHWHGYHYQTNAPKFSELFTKSGIAQLLFIRKLRKIFAQKNISFLAISKHIKQYVVDRLKVSADRVRVIYNGFDETHFKREISTAPKDVFKLVSIGSFHPIKGQEFLIDVMKIIKAKGHSNFRLTLIGDGPQRKQLEQRTKENGVQNIVHFTGVINDPEKHLHGSHVYVHSALLEGFGLVIVEAMGCGLPVVATNGGGNAEIIKNGHDGYVIENRNAEEFAEKVIYLEEHPDIYAEFCSNSYESSKVYTLKKFSDNIYKYYQEILA
ncbi:MAG: glycosyl transferase group 1 [Bacteroidota bacterium]|nr:glycosyl transferase group 1 [Bacteroidota bacterium]